MIVIDINNTYSVSTPSMWITIIKYIEMVAKWLLI